MKKLYTFIILSSFFCLGIQAQTIYVNTNATGANDGTSWANAYSELSAAFDNHDTGDVWIAAGTYVPGSDIPDSSSTFFVRGAMGIYGGFAGTETDLSERDIDNNETILSGDINGDDQLNDFDTAKEDNVNHVMLIDSLIASPIIIDGLHFTAGHTSSPTENETFWSRGAGLYTYSTINISNCEFSNSYGQTAAAIFVAPYAGGGSGSTFTNLNIHNNYADLRSAGIYFFDLTDVTVTDCIFKDNLTNRGTFYPNDSHGIRITGCTFENNRTAEIGDFGGALFTYQCTDMIFEDCSFFGNAAGNGSIIYCDGRDLEGNGTPDVYFNNCNFVNNTVTEGSGGIRAWKSSMEFTGCTFDRNLADNGSNAAAMTYSGDFAVDNETVNIIDCTFSNNVSNWGGSIINWGTTMNVSGCTFQNNEALISGSSINIGDKSVTNIDECIFLGNLAQFGGAIYSQNDSAIVNISNSDFSFNEASANGGVIAVNGGNTFNIDNCNFENNTGDFGGAIHANDADDDATTLSFLINNSVFKNNIAYTQGAGLSLIDANADIVNCEITKNSNSGEGSGGGLSLNATNFKVINTKIINSTIAGNIAEIGSGIGSFTDSTAALLVVNLQNTILDNAGSNYEVEDGMPLFSSNGGNISTDATTETAFIGTNDMNSVADVMFKDILFADYSLAETSPAVNNGIADGAPSEDLLGKARMDETDSGCYEYIFISGLGEVDFEENSVLNINSNPVLSSELNFSLDNEWNGEVQLMVFDVIGNRVLSQKDFKPFGQWDAAITLDQFRPGVYDLIILQENKAITQKFVKM